MPGIYIHIPFCRKACHYCDFHFITNTAHKSELVEALTEELALKKHFFNESKAIDTIYLGGGTPSLLTEKEIDLISSTLYNCFSLEQCKEWTLEANPEDITLQNLASWKNAGINRLSIGVQSFIDDQLTAINRNHTSKQAEYAIKLSQDNGFSAISVDLMFGLPGLGLDQWEYNLAKTIDFSIPHLSVYALTVEEKTALHYQVKQNKVKLPNDSVFEQQYLYAHRFLEESGYSHYEISNYALNEAYALHNSRYWDGDKYLGIGPSAHSYDGVFRYWNIRNNAQYIKKIKEGKLVVDEKEELGQRERYHEYLLTHFRQQKGIRLSYLLEQFNIYLPEKFSYSWNKWVNSGIIWQEGDVCRLSPEGWFLSNEVVSDFFLD